jgi:hypothetical protein
MFIVDAQLHEPAVSLPWTGASRETRWDVMVELLLGYMRAVGVAGVVANLRWRELAAEPARLRTRGRRGP